MLKRDPVEDTLEFKSIEDELQAKIIAKIGKKAARDIATFIKY